MAQQSAMAQPADGWSGDAIKRDKLGYGSTTESPSVFKKYICTKPVLVLAMVLLAIVIFVLGRPVLWAMVPELKQTLVDDSGAVQTVAEDEKEAPVPDIIAGAGPDQEEVIGKQGERIEELKQEFSNGGGSEGSAGGESADADSNPLVSEAKQVMETAASAKDAAMAIAGNENVGEAAPAASEAAEAAEEVVAAAKSVMEAARGVENAADAKQKGEAVQALEAAGSSATEALAHADKVAESAKTLAREARRSRDRSSASAARDTATVATAAAKEAKSLIRSATEAAEKFRLENAGGMKKRKVARRLLSALRTRCL